jgi:hypothetical protein
MMDHDFSAIKPVENLPGIAGLTPAGQQDRKRRPNLPRRDPQPQETPPGEAAEEQTPQNSDDPHTIDYRA